MLHVHNFSHSTSLAGDIYRTDCQQNVYKLMYSAKCHNNPFLSRLPPILQARVDHPQNAHRSKIHLLSLTRSKGIILHHDATYGVERYGMLVSGDCSSRNCGRKEGWKKGWMALMEQSEQSLILQWNASAPLSFHLIYVQIHTCFCAVETKWQLVLFKNSSLLYNYLGNSNLIRQFNMHTTTTLDLALRRS